MATNSPLDKVEDAVINTGKFKYILIKVHHTREGQSEIFKHIVRGFTWAGFHADIYDKVSAVIEGDGLDCECVGGGRIQHNPDQKTIMVYGYSQGYGKADHSVSCDILRKKYPGYDIKWSDDGY